MKEIPKNSYLIVIGAMKCGTSTLYWYLTQHERICPCILKEPEFFSERQGHGQGVENYSDLWEFDIKRHDYAIEASTGYTKYPYEANVASNIKNYGISPTFLYIVRNPFDRIESHYNWSIHRKWFNPRIKISDDRFINYSNYYLQLEPYRQHFGKGKIIVLDFDKMVENPEEFLHLLFGSLKLRFHDYQFNNSVINKTRSLTQTEVFFRKHPFLKNLKNVLPQPSKDLLKKIYKEPFRRVSRKKKLNTKERAYIYDKLKDDMSLFGALYNFSINKWGF